MRFEGKLVVLKDSTLREGRDVAGVDFSVRQKVEIVRCLEKAGVSEIEIVAPARVLEDLEFARVLRAKGNDAKTSGLVYAASSRIGQEIEQAGRYLDRLDILMPLASQREPFGDKAKMRSLVEALREARRHCRELGAGFPHATQANASFLKEIALLAMREGAGRITLYDTNGSADPFSVFRLVRGIKAKIKAPVFFHAHNDLGLAAANALAAVVAGSDGLDVTVNGLGDRAGNAALEQVAMGLYLRQVRTGIRLDRLKTLSCLVARSSGIAVPFLAPVVGEAAALHKSPTHKQDLSLFEAFDPRLVASRSRFTRR